MAEVKSDDFGGCMVPESELTYALPKGPDKKGKHCWANLPAESFQVRGLNYTTDKKKYDSDSSVFELAYVEMFKCKDKLNHLCELDDLYLPKARKAGDKRLYLVIVFLNPGKPFVYLNLYFATTQEKLDQNPKVKGLWEQFVSKDDDFRNDRWKVIPRISEGNWMVKRAIGTTPALLGRKLTHNWIVNKEGNYIEVDCDVTSSKMASLLVGMLKRSLSSVVVDLAFVIQGESPSELPEHILGTVKLARMSLKTPIERPGTGEGEGGVSDVEDEELENPDED